MPPIQALPLLLAMPTGLMLRRRWRSLILAGTSIVLQSDRFIRSRRNASTPHAGRSTLLASRDSCACNAIELPVGKATASHHFKVLRLAGVILQHDEGTRRISRLRRDELEQRFPGLLESVLRAAQSES